MPIRTSAVVAALASRGVKETLCARFLSLRWSETTEAILLPTDGHEAQGLSP